MQELISELMSLSPEDLSRQPFNRSILALQLFSKTDRFVFI